MKAFCEVLSEEYPAPVCNGCCVTMLVRTEVFRGDEGSHIEVRCGFRCTNCYSILPFRFEKKRTTCVFARPARRLDVKIPANGSGQRWKSFNSVYRPTADATDPDGNPVSLMVDDPSFIGSPLRACVRAFSVRSA
jgi:hypothetical protein